MAVDRLKFRCYQCTQLLAVAPSKAGSIVACPKCKAELLIPAPAEETARASGSLQSTRSSSRDEPSPGAQRSNGSRGSDDPTSQIPPELADLRPEDIRIEPSVLESLANSPQAELEPADDSPFASGVLNFSEPSTPVAADPAVSANDPPFNRTTSPLNIAMSEPDSIARADQVGVPIIPIAGIDIASPRITGPSVEKRTIREVVLPAGVVLAWSLFVLLSLGMAFIAGLLVGHFIWTPLN